MEGQHTENLLRHHKGKFVRVKGLSGGEYSGNVVEVTNDYVSLSDPDSEDKTQTVVLFKAIESVTLGKTP
jgi:hypothetical protein